MPWIKKTFGIEMGATHFSAIKSQYLKKQAAAPVAEPAKGGRKPRVAGPVAEAVAAPAPNAAANGSQPDLMTALVALKPLVASLGVEKVKRLAELLG